MECSSEILRIWTLWLYREFDQINAYYRLGLMKPLIKVGSLMRKLGTWNSVTRTISINSTVIEGHPWNEVINILKHEMAHQWVTENYRFSERPHGPGFVEACRLMGLPNWAIRASGDLPDDIPDWRQTTLSAGEQRLLTKAQKLLALAASDNEHEASLAMQRVRELYSKYNLDLIEAQAEARFVSWVMISPHKRMAAWDTLILSMLNKHFFVRVIHIKQFDAEACKQVAAAEVMGKQENVLMAEYVFGFLKRTLEALWQRHQAEIGTCSLRGQRRNFFLGVLNGFGKQLEMLEQKSTPHRSLEIGKALMITVDQELDGFLKSKYPRTTSFKGTRADSNSEAYQRGKSEGEKIRLNRPLAHSDGNRGLRLTK